ncbi:hypothetical protein CYY_009721 [Polysphondylium violaceum]|uniref:phosphoserine phosphatase n=1 Tax=Polysphondylium violaceum TaxID=133409 RepID=A0A8J4PJR6_9MYCE|nr:hypothetical protein CYY_009721 [Polysphondylium violaceum]
MTNKFILIVLDNSLDIEKDILKTLWNGIDVLVQQSKSYDLGYFKVQKVILQSDKPYSQLNQPLHSYFYSQKVDFYFHEYGHFNTFRKLAVFDMDSCIIKNECIDEMAAIVGVSDKVSDITSRAMAGELDFNQALKERLMLLKDMPIGELENVWKKIELSDGAHYLISTLKKWGYKTALVSGGFSFFAYRVASRLGMDYAVSNELEFNQSSGGEKRLTGSVVGERIVNADVKRSVSQALVQLNNGISQMDTIAMGDGSNDIKMIQYVHMGVAIHGKPILRQSTPFQINFNPMAALVCYLPEFWQQLDDNSNNTSTTIDKDSLFNPSLHKIESQSQLVSNYTTFQQSNIFPTFFSC